MAPCLLCKRHHGLCGTCALVFDAVCCGDPSHPSGGAPDDQPDLSSSSEPVRSKGTLTHRGPSQGLFQRHRPSVSFSQLDETWSNDTKFPKGGLEISPSARLRSRSASSSTLAAPRSSLQVSAVDSDRARCEWVMTTIRQALSAGHRAKIRSSSTRQRAPLSSTAAAPPSSRSRPASV